MADRYMGKGRQLSERGASRSVNIFRANRSNRGHDFLRSMQSLMNRIRRMRPTDAIRIVTESTPVIPYSLTWTAWLHSSDASLFRHASSIPADSAAALVTMRQRKLGTFTCYGRAGGRRSHRQE